MRKPPLPRLSILVVAVAAASIAAAQSRDDCALEVERNLDIEADGAQRIEIVARTGRLVVARRPNLDTIRVRGRACTSASSGLEGMEITDSRSGSTIRIETRLPGRFGNSTAYLDLFIDVPLGLETAIEETSGAIELHGLGDVTVENDSGEIDLDLDQVASSAEVRDRSGTISLGAGAGNVTIRRDGSGSIDVINAGGPSQHNTGDVSYYDANGALRAPEGH